MMMKFMLILKSTKDSEAGKMPSEEAITAMVKYNQEQAKAGILLDAAGLYPSSRGARIRFATGGKTTVIDGPFTESKELVAGYWLIQVKSLGEAIEWAKRSPFSPNSPDQETEIEVREFIEFE
ncbi:MAG TPA: YciI family protein [Nitrospira sp.]|nr:YciI family protein [Nitrospira sp.]